MSILSIGIIILEDYILDTLIGIVRIGRHNIIAKEVNKVSLRKTIISIGNKRRLKYNKLIRHKFRKRLIS